MGKSGTGLKRGVGGYLGSIGSQSARNEDTYAVGHFVDYVGALTYREYGQVMTFFSLISLPAYRAHQLSMFRAHPNEEILVNTVYLIFALRLVQHAQRIQGNVTNATPTSCILHSYKTVVSR
jgi:hypothetical protein